MPLVRCNAKLLYFAHIPKCGGSSVEDYLRDRFKAVGFYDPNMHQTPPARRWSRTSPQHVDWTSLQRLLPAELLDEVFAVVRHPVSRIVSGYHFQVEVEKAVAPDTSFSDWLAARHARSRRIRSPSITISGLRSTSSRRARAGSSISSMGSRPSFPISTG